MRFLATGSRSEGSEQIGAGSNRGHLFRIGRWGLRCGGSGGGTHRSSLFRGGATGNSPEFIEPGVLRFKSIGVWPGTIAGACVIYLATQGKGLGRGAPCAAAAALGWRMSPARHARTPKACYGPQQHAQRIEGWLLVLTGVQDWRGSRAEGASAWTGGEGETELASGVEGGVRRAPGCLRSTRGAPVARADLARGSGGAGAWWSAVAAAAQRHGVAERGGAGWRRR